VFKVPEAKAFVFEITVCGTPACWFVHTTVVPLATVMVEGVNAKFWMVTIAVVGVGVGVGVDFGVNVVVGVGAFIDGCTIGIRVVLAEAVLFAALVVVFVSFTGDVIHPVMLTAATIIRAISNMIHRLCEFMLTNSHM
jgi:hypothetical protein